MPCATAMLTNVSKFNLNFNIKDDENVLQTRNVLDNEICMALLLNWNLPTHC